MACTKPDELCHTAAEMPQSGQKLRSGLVSRNQLAVEPAARDAAIRKRYVDEEARVVAIAQRLAEAL